MKKILTSLTIIASLTVVGCSTNTQNENTGIGAVGGAVVGGGIAGLAGGNPAAIALSAVGGALVGGFVGHSMDSTDNTYGSTAMQSNSTNETRSWVNSRTGTAYSMTPTSGRFAHGGYSDCRRFHFTATMRSGRTERYNGTACLMSDGYWHTVK